MPNGIKYTTGAVETGCLKKGNMLIANNTSDYGTSFYNGINPPAGGYTIYLNKASGGPSIYCPANDTQLVSITNQIAGANYTTAAQCLSYFAGQSDKLCVNFNYEGIVTSGLVLNLDAGFNPSYPTTGTTWYDLSGNANNGTLQNGPTFNSANSGSIVFDGVDDYVSIPHNSLYNFSTGAFTISIVVSSSQLKSFSYYLRKGGPTPWNNSPAGWYATSGNGGGDLSWYWVFANGTQHTEITPFSTFSKSNDTFPLNFFTITRDSNGSFARSWNGLYETIPTIPIIGTSTWNASFDNSTDVLLGSGALKGNISIFQIYNRALTSSEILQNYNAQKGRFGL